MSAPPADYPQDGQDASPSKSSNSIPFPEPDGEQRLKESASSASNLTSSDKLSALPTQSSSVLGRLRTPTRTARRSVDASSSLTSIDSATGSPRALHSLPSGAIRQSNGSESSLKDTPRQRNESERSLPATLQNARQSIPGRLGHSDSAVASPSLRSRENLARGQTFSQSPPPSRQGHSQSASNRPPSNNLSPLLHGRDTFQTPSRSPAQSRAASPLRILQGWNLHRHTRDEPFIPVDPFSSHIRWFGLRREHSPTRPPAAAPSFATRAGSLFTNLCGLITARSHHVEEDGEAEARAYREEMETRRKRQPWRALVNDMTFLFSYSLPRFFYLWFLLHLPALYWQRVARVFEDAEVSKPEIQRLIDACGIFAHDPSVDAAIATGFATPTTAQKPLAQGIPYPEEWSPPMVSPALARFKLSWETFVDTLMREWKTFNLVSALLCTTILTIFQIQDAADDPLTRWSALFSLVFALWSLSYGCVYIVHFGTMRSMDRASRWAEEAQKTRASLFWNIWVLLATPAIWLAWSMISFCVSILSFVWRTGSQADQDGWPPLTTGQALVVRICISVVFAFGLFNFLMIIRTFSSYSHLSVRRDRRSRFLRSDEDRGRERERARGGRGGKRQGPHSDDEKALGKLPSDSMVGLGLTGVGNEAGSGVALRQGSPSQAGVILENIDLEKGDAVYLAGERVGVFSRASPKTSPKL